MKIIKKQRIKIAVIIIGVLVVGLYYNFSRSHDHVTDGEALIETTEETSFAVLESISVPIPETEVTCYIHICGEVHSPGVYEVEAGSRIFQAVEEAHGFTENAATEYLNMAETICDGMKIVVPDKREIDATTGGVLSDSTGKEKTVKVNLNKATKEELMTLRGVGEAKAADIIKYREEHDGFKKIEDIMKISGIKDAAFQKIRDDITV